MSPLYCNELWVVNSVKCSKECTLYPRGCSGSLQKVHLRPLVGEELWVWTVLSTLRLPVNMAV